ncbi:MAG: hypothetical protein GX089_03580 [Fibrobacter sp.]|jgi:pyruvate,water dikinase|nr:hypothetical protein [Fibrobacter sp.]
MRTFIQKILLTVSVSLLFTCDSPPSSGVNKPDPQYPCAWKGGDTLDFLDSITCPDEFAALQGSPIVQTVSGVKTVKVVYEISSKRLYYVSSGRYWLHFDFCSEVLNYGKSHALFNDEQYGAGPERLYYLANVDYYSGSGIYTVEFFADDRISVQGIKTLFEAVKNSSYFGEELKFFPNSTKMKAHLPSLSGVPTVSEDELYGGQKYQALNTGEAYGWLRRVEVSDAGSRNSGRHDILIVNGLPLDIPVIAGIITTVFQTPLSHINVLSHNRGTPNMALKSAWDDEKLKSLENKLVYLNVKPDTFLIREASREDAEAFWSAREPSKPVTLECNDYTPGIFDISQLSHSSVSLVGAKAANFAELSKITMGGDTIPVPEGAFAIPFYYYRRHLKKAGLDKYVEWMLSDSLFRSNYNRRYTLLKTLRDSIISTPLDQSLTSIVEEKIGLVTGFSSFRFRSSTNAEDIKGFNGAGLYESHTAVKGDPDKTVSSAIRKVFASLWTMRGFEERDYFKIDQLSVAMGILVHRSFPHEEVNGVAITGNIYFPLVPAYTINAQLKDISVVNPPPGFTADQLLFHIYSSDAFTNPAIEYIIYSNANGGIPVMTNDEIVLLAKWLNAINQHFYIYCFRNSGIPYNLFSMDVEFKLDGPGRKLYIKQARPY